MKSIRYALQLMVFLVFAAMASGCEAIMSSEGEELKGSGVVEAVEVVLALETGGQVADVFVDEGDQVESDDVLVTLEDNLIKTEYDQAVAALNQAQANYDLIAAQPRTEERQLAIATAQLELLSAQQALRDLIDNADLAQAQALQAVEDAQDALDAVNENFAKEKAAALLNIAVAEEAVRQANHSLYYFTLPRSQTDLDTFEGIQVMSEALEKAREAYEPYKYENIDYDQVDCMSTTVANRFPDICREQTEKEELRDDLDDAEGDLSTAVRRLALEVNLANAEADLEKAMKDFAALGDGPSMADIALLEAQLAAAERDYESVKDGPDPDDIALAEARVQTAEANLALAHADTSQEQLDAAQAQVDAAQAALDIVQAQYDKLVLASPVDGIVLYRTVEPGEVVLPGSPAITLGLLDELSITVYIPEDRYGQINIGDKALVKVDSFPGETFDAVVVRIADQAEYTPRNVQTEEDRRTTVFAVELSVDDPQGKLKPGMPADVTFGQ
jgi:multidrug resistance efflux pump